MCVGLGMKQPVMMRSDQEIPLPRTLGSLKLGGGVRVGRPARVNVVVTGGGGGGRGEEQSQRRKSQTLAVILL